MPSSHRQFIGKTGEEVAADFLKKKGLRVLKMNYRLHSIGEIDIIAREKNGTLVFVEVKSGVGLSDYLKPEDHFTAEKIWRVRRLAQDFVNRFPDYLDKKLGFRIDLVVIVFSENSLSNDTLNEIVIRHYLNF